MNINSVNARCTGCATCVGECPLHCISFGLDEEGFYRPYADEGSCINCGKCYSSCHVINPVRIDEMTRESFYGYCSNDIERNDSTSGGAFSALAESVLRNNGVVYGACFNYESLFLEHHSTKETSLKAIKKTKYIESNLLGVVDKINDDLEKGRTVLFCGTPCEVSGIRKGVLDRKGLLITVDFVCHGVPSAKLFHDHLKSIIGGEHLVDLDFRPKEYGWEKKNLKICTNKRVRVIHYDCDSFYYGFLKKNIFLRKTCYHCPFRKNHVADITLADFWEYKRVATELSKINGLSLIICNTEIGQRQVRKLHGINLKQIDNELSEYVYKEKDYSEGERLREQFYKVLKESDINHAIKTMLRKEVLLNRIKSLLRRLIRNQ